MTHNYDRGRSDGTDWANLAANAANNAQLRSLRRENREREEREALLHRQDAERSFAHWRQTGEGKVFLEWKEKHQRQMSVVISAEKEWQEAHEEVARTIINPDDWECHRTNTWIAPPHKTGLFKILVAIPVVSLASAALLAFLLSAIPGFRDNESLQNALSLIFFVLVWGGIALAVAYGVFGKKVPTWEVENAQERERRQQIRVAQMGYDPLSSEKFPPSIWKADARRSAVAFSTIVNNAVLQHPAPSDLFPIARPQLILESDVYPPQLVPHYRRIVEKVLE